MAADWSNAQFPTFKISADTAKGSVLVEHLHDELLQASTANAGDLISIIPDVAKDQVRLIYSTPVDARDRSAIATIVSSHAGDKASGGDLSAWTPTHLEEEYDQATGNRLAERYYSDDLGGVLSGLVEETVYTYAAGLLTQEVWSMYGVGGNVVRTKTWNHTTEVKAGKTFTRRKLA